MPATANIRLLFPIANVIRWREAANRAMLSPDVGRLQIALVAPHRLFRSRASLEAEILILRQQIIVLRRTAPKRLSFNGFDRLIFVGLHRLFPDLREVQMETRLRLEPALYGLRLMGRVIVDDQMQVDAGVLRSTSLRKRRNSRWRWRGMHVPITLPSSMFSAANRVVVPLRLWMLWGALQGHATLARR